MGRYSYHLRLFAYDSFRIYFHICRSLFVYTGRYSYYLGLFLYFLGFFSYMYVSLFILFKVFSLSFFSHIFSHIQVSFRILHVAIAASISLARNINIFRAKK